MKFNAQYLSDKEIEVFQNATLMILEKGGVRFQSEAALEIFKKNGAKIDGEIVYIDEKLLNKALKTAQRSFTVYGRGSEVLIGGDRPALAPASGPVFVKRDGKKRLATQEDYIDFLKLTESSKVINFANYIVVEPQDMPEDKRKLYQIAQTLKYTTKPIVGMAMGEGMSEKALELVSKFYGGLDKNRMLGIISPISPLSYDEGMIEHVFAYAKHRQPLMFAACSLPGATSPVSVAGTIAVDNAEVLAGIVLAQLIAPEMPVLYGSTSTACDMRFLAPSIGSPETGLISASVTALAHSYGLPCRTGGTLTDAKALDMQMGIETAMTLMSAISAGADFVLHAAGVMDSFNTVSLEKFIIDEDTISSILRMKRGYETDDLMLTAELICALGSGAHYVAEDHTLDNYMDEMHTPKLFSREGYDKWEEDGAQSIFDRAQRELAIRLEKYQMPPLEAERLEILDEYIR